MKTFAALYVQADGIYASMPGADLWSEERDARTYGGSLPVVAHPPCGTWGRYYRRAGGLGNDGGCFTAALEAVRRCGGVIEHPAGSKAWARYGLPRPNQVADSHGGWTISVHQRWWGHEAIKPTWVYVVGVDETKVPVRPLTGFRPVENMAKRQREATPLEFAKWLSELAISSQVAAHA